MEKQSEVQLTRVVMEFDDGRTLILTGKSLEEYEKQYRQGMAAILQLGLIQKQKAQASSASPKPVNKPWGRPPPSQSPITEDNEKIVSLKQVLDEKEGK